MPEYLPDMWGMHVGLRRGVPVGLSMCFVFVL